MLLCTPEVTELPEGIGNAANFVRAKGGGLADISAGLFAHLHESPDFDVHIAMPKYDRQFVGGASDFRRLELDAPKWERQGIHLVSDSAFTKLDQVYEQTGSNSPVRRSLAFQRMVINRFLDTLTPDLVHCNDWMTGLIPAACRDRGIPCVFTIHNLFTLWSSPAHIDAHGIDVARLKERFWYQWFPRHNESDWHYNQVDFASSGVFSADVVNTVSPTFAEEIRSGYHDDWAPPSLISAIKEHAHFIGILNAPNDHVRPDVSGRGFVPFRTEDVELGKAENKARIQTEAGLEVSSDRPLLFWPHRLYAQKNPELVLDTIELAIERHAVQIVVVANGDRHLEARFDVLSRRRPGSVARRRFDQGLSNLARAGSDFVLMPSRYEPCGLPQLECPRFGTLPIVRATGGLADTVTELSADRGNGFVFREMGSEPFLAALDRAIAFFRADRSHRELTLKRIMCASLKQFSLTTTTQAYMNTYAELLA